MFYGYEHIIDGTYVSNFSELLRYVYEKYCKLNSHYLERRSLIKLHYAWTKIYSKKNQNLFYYAKVELYLTCVKVVRTFELVKKNAKEMLSLKSNLLVLFFIFSNFFCRKLGYTNTFLYQQYTQQMQSKKNNHQVCHLRLWENKIYVIKGTASPTWY